MNTIKYFGVEVEVPEWASYIATDSDGEVWAFSSEPTKGQFCFLPDENDEHAQCKLVDCQFFNTSFNPSDWQKSLQGLKQ